MYYVHIYIYIYVQNCICIYVCDISAHVYIYIPCTIRPKHVRRPPVARNLAPLPRRCSTARTDPRAPRGLRGPALQHQDLRHRPLTIDLNQKKPLKLLCCFCLLVFYCRCESNQTGKTKQKTVSRTTWRFLKEKNCSNIRTNQTTISCSFDIFWSPIFGTQKKSPQPNSPGGFAAATALISAVCCTWCIKGPRLAAPAAFGRWRAAIDVVHTTNNEKGWCFFFGGGNFKEHHMDHLIWFI